MVIKVCILTMLPVARVTFKRSQTDNKAHFVYEGGGTIKLVDKETGETLASCDTARGNQKWTMGSKSGQRNVLESVVSLSKRNSL